MKMTNHELPEQFFKRPFTAKEAQKRGLSRYFLKKMLDNQKLILLARGVYQWHELHDDLETQFRTATIRIGKPSSVCLLSALEYYNLTDIIANKTYLMVEQNKRVLHQDIKVYRSKNPHWNIGIEKKDGYWISSLERTLVESLLKKNIFGYIPMQSLKLALRKKKTNISKIMDMAILLKCQHRLYDNLEAFL